MVKTYSIAWQSKLAKWRRNSSERLANGGHTLGRACTLLIIFVLVSSSIGLWSTSTLSKFLHNYLSSPAPHPCKIIIPAPPSFIHSRAPISSIHPLSSLYSSTAASASSIHSLSHHLLLSTAHFHSAFSLYSSTAASASSIHTFNPKYSNSAFQSSDK